MGYGWSGWVGDHIWKPGFNLNARNVPAVCLRRVKVLRRTCPWIIGGHFKEFLLFLKTKKPRNANRFRAHQVSARIVGYESIC